jgi:hypothetical protein
MTKISGNQYLPQSYFTTGCCNTREPANIETQEQDKVVNGQRYDDPTKRLKELSVKLSNNGGYDYSTPDAVVKSLMTAAKNNDMEAFRKGIDRDKINPEYPHKYPGDEGYNPLVDGVPSALETALARDEFCKEYMKAFAEAGVEVLQKTNFENDKKIFKHVSLSNPEALASYEPFIADAIDENKTSFIFATFVKYPEGGLGLSSFRL